MICGVLNYVCGVLNSPNCNPQAATPALGPPKRPQIAEWPATTPLIGAGQMGSYANGVGRIEPDFSPIGVRLVPLKTRKHMISRDIDRILTGFYPGFNRILTGFHGIWQKLLDPLLGRPHLPGAKLRSTLNMTGRSFHCTMEVVPALPWRSKSPSVSRPMNLSIE